MLWQPQQKGTTETKTTCANFLLLFVNVGDWSKPQTHQILGQYLQKGLSERHFLRVFLSLVPSGSLLE